MTVDERVRTAVHDAASGPALDVELALWTVRSRVETVDLVERPRPPARGPRLVAALAACALIAGAVALPFALRSTRHPTPAPAAAAGRCGHTLTTGYRSTAVVRIAASTSVAPYPELGRPAPAALGLCDAVLAQVHPKSDDVNFAATTNGDQLSLVVSTPTRDDAAALAHAWAGAFVDARRAEARRQIVQRQRWLVARVIQLHDELRRVDTQLAQVAPGTYQDVASIDATLGRSPDTVPPVPEHASVDVLNLAFERVSILDRLRASGSQAATLRVELVKPQAYATLVSLSPAARFPTPGNSSRPTGVLLAVGLIAGGVLLASGGFFLGRRARRGQAP